MDFGLIEWHTTAVTQYPCNNLLLVSLLKNTFELFSWCVKPAGYQIVWVMELTYIHSFVKVDFTLPAGKTLWMDVKEI